MRSLSFCLFLTACNGTPAPSDCASTIAVDCGACYSGETTCTYDEYSETRSSCQECQARVALSLTLCEAEVEFAEEDFVCETTSPTPDSAIVSTDTDESPTPTSASATP